MSVSIIPRSYQTSSIEAQVGRSVTLTSGCVIGAKCSLTTNETLPENTVVFGSEHQRRTMPDRPAVREPLAIESPTTLPFMPSSSKRISSTSSLASYRHRTTFSSTARKATPRKRLDFRLPCLPFDEKKSSFTRVHRMHFFACCIGYR